MAEVTKAVVASLVSLLPAVAVGALGIFINVTSPVTSNAPAISISPPTLKSSLNTKLPVFKILVFGLYVKLLLLLTIAVSSFSVALLDNIILKLLLELVLLCVTFISVLLIVIIPLLSLVTVVAPEPCKVIVFRTAALSVKVNLVLPLVVIALAAAPVPAYKCVI